ncbi:MAG: nucleotide exchange factor GrpE [Chlorobi bacterium]|nr:nucleotide exchange factor GrpE [Chlorobiota bacterium]
MRKKEEKNHKRKEQEANERRKEKETVQTETGVDAEEKKKTSDKNDVNVSKDEIISKLKEENEALKETLLRKVAEFENYKRRTENEISEMLKYAAQEFILEMLNVYNDLRRSLEHIKDAKDINAIKAGLEMVFDKFSKALKNQGVERMEVKGKEFDFNFHDALMQRPSAEVPDGTVLEEIEPGYIYKDKVLKHAKVIVSQEVEQKEETEN